MELKHFNQLVQKVHDHHRLTPADQTYVRQELPLLLRDYRTIFMTREYQHPAGLLIRGAPVRSFLSSYALLLAKKTYGKKGLPAQPLYAELEKRLVINLMRSNFEHGQPKGFFCCKICTLAIFPLLALDMFYLLEGKRLAPRMRAMIENREGPFEKGLSTSLVDFSLSF